ncbi:MAG TPA: TonB family protein, partial [Terriglobales bacterium]|nr:TonB family protein [Terriglobales bacterium]
ALLGVLVLALGLFLLLRAIRGPQTQIATAAAPQPVAAEPVSVAVPAPAAPAPKVEQRRVEARPLIESRRAPSPQPKQNVIAVAADTPGKPVSAPEPPPTEALFAQGGDSVAVSQLVGSLPATAPELAKAIRVSTGVAKPVLLHRVEPIYPAMAKQGGIEGSVVLDATVNKSGRVDNLQVISGNSLLVAAAVQAVRQWRYRPYRLNDQVIEVPVRITLNFKLGR